MTELFADTVREYVRLRDFDGLKQYLHDFSAHEIIEGLFQCRDTDQPVVFRLLSKDMAVRVFDIMDPAMQGEIIESLTSKKAADLLGVLDPVDQVRLFDEMPAAVSKRLLGMLPAEQRNYVSRLMGYEDGMVGRVMSPVFVDVKKDITVREAIKKLRAKTQGSDELFHSIYVTDETRRLIGVIHISRLITAPADVSVAELLEDGECESVTASEDEEQAARLMQRLNVVDLPVVDGEHRLIGVLNAEDAMDVISEEVTDDMYDKVGLLDIAKLESDRSYHLLHGGFFHAVAVGVPFLLITLLGACWQER